MENLKEINQKIEEIYTILSKIDFYNFNSYGIVDGLAGILMFVCEYEKKYLNNKFDLTSQILASILSKIAKIDYNYTFSTGISGTNLVLKKIISEKILDNDTELFLKKFTRKIDNLCFKNIQQRTIYPFSDFLHGELGEIWAINSYSEYEKKRAFQKYLRSFIALSGIEKQGFFFSPPNYTEDKQTISLGISHGVPASLIILAQSLKAGSWEEKILEKIKFFIDNTKNDNKYSVFPSFVVNENKTEFARLGWCYGDLGIGLSFWLAGKKTKKSKWQQDAIDIFLASIHRTDLEKEKIFDAGLCHGTAGIAHMYNRIYFETKNKIFRESANYWIEKTLEMAYHQDGLAGFALWRGEEKGWLNDYCFLEGISGIGLTLLSHTNPEVEPTWDKSLLLS